MTIPLPHRRWLSCLVAATALLLPACGWDGHLCFLGYTTRPNYDPTIHTVYVNMFNSVIQTDTQRRWLEEQLTQAIVREIEMKTPWKVTSNRACADTELSGKIMNMSKRLMVFNQLGETRDNETTLTCEVVWRDLRQGHSGEMLSAQPPGRPQDPVPLGTPPVTGPPVIVQSRATFTPELGQSMTTAEQTMIDQMATQIVQMMEKPW